jgi:AraC-like DNA-binding protein
MSDFSKTRSTLAGYESQMDAEHLLLFGQGVAQPGPAAARRFEQSAGPFTLTVVPVATELSKDIDSVSILEGSAADPQTSPMLDVVPGTQATLCITYGPKVEHAGAAAPSTFSGLFSKTRSYRPKPAIGVVIVAFKPGGFRRYVGESADAFAETNVAVDDLWGPSARHLEDRVASTNDATTRGRLVQRFLVERRAASGWDPLAVRLARTIVDAGGDVSMRALAADAGLSERQFERRFSAAVGLRPKRFARLARFTRAVTLARTGLPWAQVACSAGFSDQSHLANEFQALVGVTPENLARRCSVPARLAG